MGPLQGVKVVEIASIGPGPWCAMMLSDMGAEVLRVDRPDHVRDHQDGQVPVDFVNRRGRRSVGVDLKHPAGAEVVLRLAEQADALIEGNRTGVAERLGIGAQECLARNPRLVYGRMTGWGQGVPLAQTPGHDLNCLALTGLLHAIGPADGRLVPPLNLVGDYGTYQTSDGKWGAVGTNEPKFYRVLVEALGLSLDELPPQMDQSSWPDVKQAIFRTRTREEWVKLLQSLETCFSPVLTLEEALGHEHSVARSAFVPVDGVLQAAPAPRFDRTPAAVAGPAARPGEHTEEALRDWGFDPTEIADLITKQAIGPAPALARSMERKDNL